MRIHITVGDDYIGGNLSVAPVALDHLVLLLDKFSQQIHRIHSPLAVSIMDCIRLISDEVHLWVDWAHTLMNHPVLDFTHKSICLQKDEVLDK